MNTVDARTGMPAAQLRTNELVQVEVVDFKIGFWSLVMFFVKCSFAVIPATIIVTVVVYAAIAAVVAIFAGFGVHR